MKTFIRLAFVFCLVAFQGKSFANTVVVKGTVKDSANHPIANRLVKIYSTDSTNGGCALSHSVITNPNGYYIDTLTCNGDIRKLVIIVENCNGARIYHYPAVTGTNNIVESDFIICASQTIPLPVTCKAVFTYASVATGIKFNSAGAYHVRGDSIISRTWTFGDGSNALTGNQTDPTHTYRKPGIYNACLTIKTKNGCQSSYCQTVVYTPGSNECKAQAVFTIEKLAPKKFRFNSAQSTTLLGDSIFERIWKFGDGSSLDGNRVNPLKEYKDTGVYNVCLSIKTWKGCEKQYCFTLLVKNTVPGIDPNRANCKAQFAFSAKGKTIRFNSASSYAPAKDSIISRNWLFGDNSSTIQGNNMAPYHSYKQAGTYTVCLYIKTKNGCESKQCAEIVVHDTVPPVPTGCKAYFTYQIKDSVVYFSSTGSKAASDSDKIISRHWYYSNNSTSVSLGGNVVDTFYKYTKPGTYYITLVIKTKSGCESRYTAPVTIPKPQVPTNCKAYFFYQIKDSVVYFNSDASKATSDSDKIISRTWYYSNGITAISLGGNVADTFYKYTKPGIYPVTLIIKTRSGCESRFTAPVTIPKPQVPTNCKAYFNYQIKDSVVYFSSDASKATSDSDKIISRTWYYSDGITTISLGGNVADTFHKYARPGTYPVTLVIRTKAGCESKFTLPVVIPALPVLTNCKAVFSYKMQDEGVVKFNSTESKGTTSLDSIISRVWIFGDSTGSEQGNIIDPSHTYKKAGKYTVTLYIKTKSGCESKYTLVISVGTANCTVEVTFHTERISLKKIQFNSSLSEAHHGDSIIQRIWKFGDNTILSGNEIKPVKEFSLLGMYNTCLQVKTLNGCEAQVCKQVVVQDTINVPPSTVNYIKIITINPNPVVTRMMATIYSHNNGTEAEITIYDIYGMPKLTVKRTLSQGNNMIEIGCEFLYHGPYFLKVSTKNGRDSKAFYKL